MFTHPASASAPGVSASTASAAAVSSTPATSPTSRTSRLRGFSYLRNYTQTHLLSRDHHGSGGGANNSSSGGGGGGGGAAGGSGSSGARPNHLVRSASNPQTATGGTPTSPTTTGANSTGSRLSQYLSSPTPATVPQEPPPQPQQRLAIRPLGSNPAAATTQSSQQPANANPPLQSPEPSHPSIPTGGSQAGSQHLQQQGGATGALTSPISAATAQLSDATAAGMVSTRASSAAEAAAAAAVAAAAGSPGSNNANGLAASSPAVVGPGAPSADTLPSIRFSAYYDPRSTRPSLIFPPMTRTLPTGSEVIRVGRYSDRELRPAAALNGGAPSAAPVGFKSKVVSRRHCEFWYDGGKWWIKDVKSSSGTFLNHIRLSSPGTESKPFPVNDGDIVQLGIDFKGGEEMIFRCVKMRLELNRGWQNKLNTFK